MVTLGATIFEKVPRTDPTPLLIDNVAGDPPASVHDNLVDCPTIIVAGAAVNVEITGAFGLTMTLTDLATIP